ncbi:MAG: glycine dehydrogenase (aminomethyl-transferring), partial [Pseudomonadota bacterium]
MSDPKTQSSPLLPLEAHDEFIARHIGPDAGEIEHMLKTIGAGSLDALMSETMPGSIINDEPMAMPLGNNEERVLEELRAMADDNTLSHSMIGLGYHPTVTPPVILRNVLENPGWYTAYTPY